MRKLSIILLLILLSTSISAESFYFKGYDVNIDVAADGKMHIVEDMDLYFTQQSHGIIRDIQDRFEIEGRSFDPIIATVENIESDDLYEIQENDDFTSIVLGDGNKYLTGDVNFKVSYDYDLGYDRNEGYDELYYNIISAAWDCEIDEVNYSVTMPFAEGIKNIWVSYGDYMTINLHDYSLSEDGRTISGTIKNLQPFQAITIRVEMEEGYYQGQVIPKDNTKLYCILMGGISLVVLGFTFLNYLRYGRDDKPVVYAQFSPPMGFNPIDVGYIIDKQIHLSREFAAMLFYWADKGYIKLEEQKVGKKKTTFILHKAAEIPEETKAYEKALFKSIFPDEKTVSVSMDQLSKSRFPIVAEQETLPEIERYYKEDEPLVEKVSSQKSNSSILILILLSIAIGVIPTLSYFGTYSVIIGVVGVIYAFIASMVAEGFSKNEFVAKAFNQIMKIVILIVVSLLTCAIIAFLLADMTDFIIALIPAVTYTITVCVGSFLSLNTEKRTAFGQKAIEGVLGYREFIEKVELDKLRLLMEQDPDIFYHTLSYAIALGLEENWVKKFKDLIIPDSDWFVGSASSIADAAYYSMLHNRLMNTYNEKVIPRSIAVSGGGRRSSSFSGSSGFSGGGFSGGGGRSW